MRIALVSEHASPLASPGGTDSGGQNVYVAQVARELGRAGHLVDVFTRMDAPTLRPVCHMSPNVRVVHIPAGPVCALPKERLLAHMPEFARRIRDTCARTSRRYDIVHANFFMSGIAAMRLKRDLGIPFVLTFHALGKVRQMHQGEADRFPPERIGIERTLVMTADRIIAECPQDHDDLVRLYGASPGAITTVPCGVDTAEMRPARPHARLRLSIANDAFVVLQLGRLVPRKGIEDVVRGVAILAREHGMRARLVVVGGESEAPDPTVTPEIGRLQSIAAAEGIASSVVFTGRRGRHELKDYYSAADVFVTTPWYEPFGITPLEAMACGTPVVGSSVGGIKHTVVDGVTGFLVPPRDAAAIADRLSRLYANRELGRAMGRAGIRHVHAHYTWAHVARALEQTYHAVLHPADCASATAASV